MGVHEGYRREQEQAMGSDGQRDGYQGPFRKRSGHSYHHDRDPHRLAVVDLRQLQKRDGLRHFLRTDVDLWRIDSIPPHLEYVDPFPLSSPLHVIIFFVDLSHYLLLFPSSEMTTDHTIVCFSLNCTFAPR